MRGLPNSIQARDVEYVLHPVTNARKHEEIGPIVIDRGEGIYVYDDQGNRYLEALAGLWSVAVGFGEKRLVEAAARQMFSSIRENINPTVAAAALLLIIGTLCLGGLAALLRWRQKRSALETAPSAI